MKRREIHPEQHQDLGKGKAKKKTNSQGFHKLLRMKREIYKRKNCPVPGVFLWFFNCSKMLLVNGGIHFQDM